MPEAAEQQFVLYRIDSHIRRFDFWFNRTAGHWLGRILPIFKDHSWSGIVSFLALLPFLTLGPSCSSFRIHQPSAYVALFGVYALFGFIAWLAHGRMSLFHAQLVTVAILFVALFVVPVLNDSGDLMSFDFSSSEMSGGLYPHLLLPFAMIMALVAKVGHWGAALLMTDVRVQYPTGQEPEKLLAQTELFEAPNKRPEFTFTATALALVMVPLQFSVELLLLPAAYVVLFSSGSTCDVWWMTGLLLLAWLLIALGEVHERLRLGRRLLQRLFGYGGLWLTSLVVIALAAAWLADVGYIRTVMEGAPWLVVQYIGAAYLLFWWMEYWLNRALSQQLLGLFHGPETPQIQVDYPFNQPVTPTTHTQPMGRVLQLHGAGRFVVVGATIPVSTASSEVCWQFHDRTSLFNDLAESAPPEHRARVFKVTKHIHQRIKTFFALFNVGLLLAMAGCVWFVETQNVHAVVEARQDHDPEELVSPRDLLFKPADATNPARPRVILLAASGGGSRAALYATSLMHGLSRIDALKDVKLVSGVSGGGLAVTWFASRRDRFVTDDDSSRSAAWTEFFEAMEHPFIVDVLHGGSEARIAQGVPLSQLLAESFGKRLFREDDDVAWRLGGVPSSLGLILNSTLCGQFPPQFGDAQKAGSLDRFDLKRASGFCAGGRLIFTNLNCREAFKDFESDSLSGNDKKLACKVVDDPRVRLASAAALNANFPPVFPNAPVEVTSKNGDVQRYWVTDGGAEENRGVISLLHVLRQAIDDAASSASSTTDPQKLVFPEIHIIVAEASADSVRYTADRGVGAVSAAKDVLALGWANTLLNDIRRHYLHAQGDAAEKANIKMHVVPMPSCFRCGGIGTHWMLPNTVRIHPTDVPAGRSSPVVELSRTTVMRMIRNLHVPEGREPVAVASPLKDSVQTVQSWIQNDPLLNHPAIWKKLQAELAPKPPAKPAAGSSGSP